MSFRLRWQLSGDLFIYASTLVRESLGPKARIGFTFDDAKIAPQLHSHLAFD